MGGKSTYMRQAALIVILAGIGSYVPAESARIGPVDRVFTRIGAADDLAGGRSTFMVEMTEAANILNNATRDSLVLMDEIGRGTSTFDGLSLAWACARHLGREIGAFTLFATHYFELTALADELPACANVHLDATEHGDQLVFLHAVKEGPANQSYGLQVARLAGVPTAGHHGGASLPAGTRAPRTRDAAAGAAAGIAARPAAERNGIRAAPHAGGRRPGVTEPAGGARRAVPAQGIAGRAGDEPGRLRRPKSKTAPKGRSLNRRRTGRRGRPIRRCGSTVRSEATRTLGLGLRLVHLQRATAHLEAVEALDGAGGLGVRGHLDEAEATGLAGVAVVDQCDRVDRAVGCEQRADGGLVGRKREVTNVDLAHWKILSDGGPCAVPCVGEAVWGPGNKA